MRCDAVQELLAGFADGALRTEERASVARHLAACPTCSKADHDLRKAQGAVRRLGRRQAPRALRKEVLAGLRRAERQANRTRALQAGSLALASICSAAAAAWITWWFFAAPAIDGRIAEAILTAHIRSLLTPQLLIQVSAADPHKVKPWFAGKVDFAPNVRDLEAEGFRLAGGRLDYLGGRLMAALVYRRREHVINVFVDAGDAALGRSLGQVTQKGYNLVVWQRDGLSYAAISDLNMTELRQLQDRL